MTPTQEELKKRVDDFNALKLPGQMPMMHMGTNYLVNDLYRCIAELEAERAGDQQRLFHYENLQPPPGKNPVVEPMNDLDKIMLNQALIMRALAILLVPGAERAAAQLRQQTAIELFNLANAAEKDIAT